MIDQWVREALENEAHALYLTSQNVSEEYVKAVEMLKNCTGKVVVTGIGKSGHIGKKSRLPYPARGRRHFSSIPPKRCTATAG